MTHNKIFKIKSNSEPVIEQDSLKSEPDLASKPSLIEKLLRNMGRELAIGQMARYK